MFEDKDWYIPNTVDVKKDLTEIEKKNISLIKRYEKYVEEYGDDYGRWSVYKVYNFIKLFLFKDRDEKAVNF